MATGDASLEAFKARLPLVDIVARHVRLTRRGREHLGLCPFHNEKTPSFSVVEEKGFYHCFGCGAHGNAIDFIMAIENLEFADALERLSDLTGIPAPKREAQAPRPDPGLAEANAAAAAWFSERLKAAEGAEARAYLERRGVPPALVDRFRLGYAPPGRGGLMAALEASGFKPERLVEAGLLAQSEADGERFDRFRHRLMFPIEDQRGRICGFGGRALGEARAKYLNTPETPLFHKGHLLYGLPQAARAAREDGRIVLVEGYMDVIALAEHGFKASVAPLGTAITEDQLKLLWRQADEPVVCLDGDRAGHAAALRLARRALPVMRAGQSLRFVLLPEGDDPDSFVRARGAEAMARLLESALPLSRMVWQAEWSARPVETPEQLAGLRRRLGEYARLAGDNDLREGLKDRFDALVDEMRQRQRRTMAPSRGDGRGGGLAAPGAPRRQGHGFEVTGELRAADTAFAEARRLLRPVLLDPSLLEAGEEDLAAIEFAAPSLERLRQEIVAWYAAAARLDASTLHDHLSRYGFARLVDQLLNIGPFMGPHSDRVTVQDEVAWRESLRAFRARQSRKSTRQHV